MATDLKKLFNDKRFLAGSIGVVAVAGLAVWYRNRNAGASGTSSTQQAAGGVGTFDSTGTDLGAALANFQASQQATLDQYGQQLSGLIGQLQNLNPGGAGPGTGPVGTAIGGNVNQWGAVLPSTGALDTIPPRLAERLRVMWPIDYPPGRRPSGPATISR